MKMTRISFSIYRPMGYEYSNFFVLTEDRGQAAVAALKFLEKDISGSSKYLNHITLQLNPSTINLDEVQFDYCVINLEGDVIKTNVPRDNSNVALEEKGVNNV